MTDDEAAAIKRRGAELAAKVPPLGPRAVADLARLTGSERRPVDQELFDRTAPAWNCISDPDGPHYLSGGTCQWCGSDLMPPADDPDAGLA